MRPLVSGLAAAIFAAALLYYAIQDVEWAAVAQVVARADANWMGLVVLLASTSLFLRACRWRVLLNAEGSASVASVFWATSAGQLGNQVLPMRGGEIVRTGMIASRHHMEGAYVFATVLCERLADVLILVCIGAAALAVLPNLPDWLPGAVRPGAMALTVSAICLAVLPFSTPFARAVIESLPVPESAQQKLSDWLSHSARAVWAFHDRRRALDFVGFTVLIWSLDLAATIVGARAVGLRMSAPTAALLIAGLGLGSALPSAPGYIGIYQFVAVTVLEPAGFSRSDAIACILVAQGLWCAVIAVCGGWGLWLSYRSRGRFR